MINDRNIYLILISNALASVGTGVAMIAVPWILAKQLGGGVLLGSLATTLNIALFFFMPLIGPAIDLYSRKKLMINLRIVFCIGLLIIYFILKADPIANQPLSITIYYSLGTVFYALNIPIKTAFVQEMIEPRDFVVVNSMLEVENQISAVITGVVAIYVINIYGLETVIVINTICYFFAIVFLFLIHLPPLKEKPIDMNFFQSFSEGIHTVIKAPRFMAMLMASSIPYVVVITYTITAVPLRINKEA